MQKEIWKGEVTGLVGGLLCYYFTCTYREHDLFSDWPEDLITKLAGVCESTSVSTCSHALFMYVILAQCNVHVLVYVIGAIRILFIPPSPPLSPLSSPSLLFPLSLSSLSSLFLVSIQCCY